MSGQDADWVHIHINDEPAGAPQRACASGLDEMP